MTEKAPSLLLKDCPTGGCGAKIGAADLGGILAGLPGIHDPNLLIGYDSSDDAAVYALGDDAAIVSTVDFFPPMVDDPRTFGRIAAANALSDIYAMGGSPLFALNLVCFPESMDKVILREILAGGAEKITEAGAVVAGGHSIYDSGIKYGLAVTGRVLPAGIRRNNSCRAGDCLVLTKALGTGLILSAHRAGLARDSDYSAAVDSMERLNRYAMEATEEFTVNAATDITGFGLMVHCLEMAGTDKTLTINCDSLPVLPGAKKYAAEYLATAAGQRNRNHASSSVAFDGISPADQEVLFDPQTSGGLLLSVPVEQAEAVCDAIRASGSAASIIGVVSERDGHAVVVL